MTPRCAWQPRCEADALLPGPFCAGHAAEARAQLAGRVAQLAAKAMPAGRHLTLVAPTPTPPEPREEPRRDLD